jgi:tetratricopeptide (TPR) repeat protein
MPTRCRKVASIPVCVIGIAIVACGARAAQAQSLSPERAIVDRIGARLAASPSDRAAPVWLEQVWAAWDVVGPDPVVRTLRHVSEDRRAARWVRDAARFHLAEAALREGRGSEARELADSLGVVRGFLVVGPLGNEGGAGLERRFPPEDALDDPIDLDAPIEGAHRPVSWREAEASGPLGVLAFDGLVHPTDGVCVFAASAVELERPRSVVLTASAEGALVVWINGREAVRDGVYRRLYPDRFAVWAVLPAGTSRVLVKVCGDDETVPALVLRVTDEDGAPLGGSFSGSPVLARRTPPRAGPRPRPLPTPFSSAWQRAGSGRAVVAELADIARYLHLTGGDDPSDPRAPALAGNAADASGAVDAGLLAAELAPERNQARARLEALLRDHPEDPLVLSSIAEVVAGGPNPRDARALCDRAQAVAPASVGAAVLEAELLCDLGLPLAAHRGIEDAVAHVGPVPALLRAAADVAEQAALPDARRRHLEALVAVRADSVVVLRQLAQLAHERGDAPSVVVARLDALEDVGWNRLPDRVWAASVLEQHGLIAEAEAALRRVVRQSPDFDEAWAALARLLAGAGRTSEALGPLVRSLELRPQDRGLSELRDHLLEADPFEEPYIEAPATFLARRGAGGGEHARWLLDLTVIRVHPSGLASRFRQIAVEVLDERGARDHRAHAIAFVPGEQQVTIRSARVHRAAGGVEEASGRFIQELSDPSIRMYYDERAEVVELPRLRPGDVVEIAYRVDDLAENMLDGHFGDLLMVQGDEPRRRAAVVLIHPRGMTIHSLDPVLTGVRHGQRCGEPDDDHCTRAWEASDVPALPPEEDRPPRDELAARVALSTFGDWGEVSMWFSGLVRDQLVPDERMRRLVDDLVRGLDTDESRVRAIHEWVVRNTRYVALEFGIHGYQPYPVTQVVDRGFGDCKDKAALLVAMLGLAGVDASMVLLRTRGAGRVPAQPPSLVLFDHAIAYVPSLDRFIDGTAEQSGISELPWMDQGVTALVVDGDGSSRLVTTPIDEPARNVEQSEIEVSVSAEGDSEARMRQSFQGNRAAFMRYELQAAALREERLVQRLGLRWPGARLVEHRFVEVEDLERPVELEVRFHAPSMVRTEGGHLAIELAQPRDLGQRWVRRSTRRTPLELGEPPHREVEDRTVVLPANATVEVLPEAVSIESQFGDLEIEVSRDGRQVRVRTVLEIRVDRVEPDAYVELRRFCHDVDRALERRLVVALP